MTIGNSTEQPEGEKVENRKANEPEVSAGKAFPMSQITGYVAP